MTASEREPLLNASRQDGASERPSYANGDVEEPAVNVDGPGCEAAAPPGGKIRMLTILLPLSFGIFLAAMDGTIVTSSYASIGNDLKQLQNTSWIATGYMLTLTSFQPLYGKLSDIFGRKACLLFAYIVFASGCLACGLARTMEELIAARIMAGIGGGGMTTVVSILISDIVPLRQRGTWQGIINIIFAIGSAAGAPIGGFLADGIGWRWAFLFQIPLTMVAFISVILALHLPPLPQSTDTSTSKFRRIDFLGAFTLIAAVFLILFGLDRGSNVSWSSPLCYGPLVSGLIFFIIFGFVEVTPSLAKEPFAPKHIIVNRDLIGSYLTNFFSFAASQATIFHVSLYAQAVRKKTASGTGAVLIPAIFAGVTGSLLAGVIMQRTGKYKLLTTMSMVSMLSGISLIDLMTALSKWYSLMGIAAGLTAMFLGGGSAVTTTLISLIANVVPADQAIATAVSYLFRSLGGVIGISISSALVQYTLRLYLSAQLEGRGVDIDEIVLKVRESLSYIETLDPAIRLIVRGSYEKAVQSAFWLSTALAGIGFISSLYIREKSLER